MEIILTFYSTNDAIRAERELLNSNIAVKVMPVPVAIRSGCGISLRCEAENYSPVSNKLINKLIKLNIVFERAYIKEGDNYARVENF